ncbi:hypothetical protein [Spirosoma endbachense]|uniref:Uncharacterized protein n=1 Tax=Spirosoma endbachense TaxID=2666025 RepID=A0A6P1VU95_9BACT|nr:hypothetical protein [Spirosoma endbachense]QHV96275.1 hypothetical protein GJR95_15180 [Spirosoma endbachense]
MLRAFFFQLALLTASSAAAQDCQPMSLVRLKQVFKASNRSTRIVAEGFSLPMLKSDHSLVYQRCRKMVGYGAEMPEVTLPELLQDDHRQRTIGFTTYDRTTFLAIQSYAQKSYQLLSSLKSRASFYSSGYTDGKVVYLFDSTSIKSVMGATQFKIALMPVSRL